MRLAILALLLVACSPKTCYVKDPDGSWREVKPGQWHYENRLCAPDKTASDKGQG